MLKVVVLSDGEQCRVRQLGLFELDGKGRDLIGPYKYTMLSVMGVFLEDEYILPTDPADIPVKPDKPVNELTPEEKEELLAYETYLAALAHEQKRLESYEGFVSDVAGYILEHCVNLEDRSRIVEASDWDTIHAAAVIPSLTMEGVAACLRDTFYGEVQESGDFRRFAGIGERQGDDSGAEAVGV